MSPWREVELGDVCEFRYGKALPASRRDGGPVPVYGSNGVVGGHSRPLTQGPTIVIGRKGSLGEVNYSEAPCWPIDTTYYVDSTSTKADLRWLSYRLARLGLTDLNRAAAIPGLNRQDAYRQRLALPPLPEQRRIAAILDQADALTTRRRQSLALLADLQQSIFLDLFAVTTANDTVAEVASSTRTGPFGSQLLHSEFVSEGVAVLGLDNVVANEFRWVERRYITAQKYEQLHRYRVHPGDVLISIMGTVGRCVVVPDDIPLAINTKHICAVTPDPEKVLPEFLRAAFLWHPESRAYLRRQTKGAIMDGLNMGIIRAMPVPLPSIDTQLTFVRNLATIRAQAIDITRSLAHLDALFSSLQSEAFSGN